MDTSSAQELDQRSDTPPVDNTATTSEGTNQSISALLEHNHRLEHDTGQIVGVIVGAETTTTGTGTATGASLSSGGRAIGVSDNTTTPRSHSDVSASFDDRLRQQRQGPRFLPPLVGRDPQRSASCGLSSSEQSPFFGHSAASSTHQSQLRKMVASHPPTSYSARPIPSNRSPLTTQQHRTASSASHNPSGLPSGPAPPPMRSSSASAALSDRVSSMTLQHAAFASESLTAYLPSSLNVNNNNRTTNTTSSDSNNSSINAAPHRYSNPNNKGWITVETSRGDAGGIPPCARSLHTAAILNGNMYIF
eukprot:scaffold11872_cov53-Attheya_sp.AAC.4